MIVLDLSIVAVVISVAALCVNLGTFYQDVWEEIEDGMAAGWRQFDKPAPIIVSFEKGGNSNDR